MWKVAMGGVLLSLPEFTLSFRIPSETFELRLFTAAVFLPREVILKANFASFFLLTNYFDPLFGH